MLRRHLLAWLVTACLIFITTVPADALPPAEQIVLLGKAPVVVSAPGTPTLITILASGWEADVTFKATTCAGSLAAYAPTPDGTPKITLTDNRPAYDTSGNVTTRGQFIYATVARRQVFPNNTLPTETQSGADCVARFALSDYVNVGDSVTSSLLSAAYTGSLVGTPTVTNGSGVLYQRAVCGWITPANQQMSSSADFWLEFGCLSPRPLNQSMVAAVEGIVTDGTHTYTCLTSTMLDLRGATGGMVASGNTDAVYGYRCKIAAGAATSLTAGAITADFIAFPWFGNLTTQASVGQDGVPITASTKTPSLHALNDIYDTTGKYNGAFAYVSYSGNTGCSGTVGTASTSAAVSNSSADPGCGAAANFPTVEAAAAAIVSFNNTNRSHSDTADGVICVRAVNGFKGWGSTDLRTLTSGATWLTIKACGTDNNTTVIDTPSTATPNCDTAVACADVADKTWIENIGFTPLDAINNQHNSVISATDSTTLNSEIVCNLCAFNTTASPYPLVYQAYYIHFYNLTINGATNGSCTPLCNWSGGAYGDTFVGGSITLAGRSMVAGPVELGLTTNGVTWGANPSASCTVFTGMLIAFNRAMNANVALTMRSSTDINKTCFPTNVGFAQNVWENITAAADDFNFLGDGDETPVNNGFQMYDAVAGGRENCCYNDGTGAGGSNQSTVKLFQIMWVVIDPIATANGLNRKSDTFNNGGSPPASGSRVGNFPARFGVGSVAAIFFKDANGSTAPGSAAWNGDYNGLTGSSTANNEGYNQSVSWTTNNSASGTGTGSGNYKPTGGAASPAYGRIPVNAGGLPGDIFGNARRNDGTGCAGAYEC